MILRDLRLHGRICRATVGVDVYMMAGFDQTDDLPNNERLRYNWKRTRENGDAQRLAGLVDGLGVDG
jgi:hypothetical protein